VVSFFGSGRVVDCILGFMVLELIVLILVRNNGSPVFRPVALLVNVGAGAALLLALRSALCAEVWQRVALWLLIALGFHLWDLKIRWSMLRTR